MFIEDTVVVPAIVAEEVLLNWLFIIFKEPVILVLPDILKIPLYIIPNEAVAAFVVP